MCGAEYEDLIHFMIKCAELKKREKCPISDKKGDNSI